MTVSKRLVAVLLAGIISLVCLSGCQETKRGSGDINAHQSVISKNPTVYCVNCGMAPSSQGMKCPVSNGSHNFKKSTADKTITCSNCGMAPSSRGTKCPVSNGSHAFREY
jgi:hypothetical protein